MQNHVTLNLITAGRRAHQRQVRNYNKLRSEGIMMPENLSLLRREISYLAEFWNPRATRLALLRAVQYV